MKNKNWTQVPCNFFHRIYPFIVVTRVSQDMDGSRYQPEGRRALPGGHVHDRLFPWFMCRLFSAALAARGLWWDGRVRGDSSEKMLIFSLGKKPVFYYHDHPLSASKSPKERYRSPEWFHQSRFFIFSSGHFLALITSAVHLLLANIINLQRFNRTLPFSTEGRKQNLREIL